MNKRILIPLIFAMMEMGQAGAPSGPGDRRIQLISYHRDLVVTLKATIGYAVVVELSGDERVDNIVVGNSGAWQVTANKRGDHLIIKPMVGAVATDLVVTTDTRRYVFLLLPVNGAEVAPFVVRFDYPQAMVPAPLVVTTPVALYKMRGDNALFPTAISDDGQRTTVNWGPLTPLPAIFAVNDQGREAIVNARMVDGDYVIEGIARRYIFRSADSRAIATRHLIKIPH